MGSGSTAIAALNTNRNFIGYELSEEYYYIIIKRLQEYEKGN
jgi:site-specific DNA-methyltransferase (adenine-specific)